MPTLSLQPIDHEDTRLHGNFTERVPTRVFDAVHKWVKNHPKGCLDLEAKAREEDRYFNTTYSQVLRKWRAGATVGADGYLSRTVTLQPPGKVRMADLKKHGHVGRAYFRDGVSLSNMPRDLRGALSEGEYVDLDLVRSHPRALVGYAHAHDVPCPALQTYVLEHKTIEAQWAQDYGVSPDVAKRLVNIILNGGTWGTWCKVNDVDAKAHKAPPAIAAIEAERDAFYELVKEDPAVKRAYMSKYQRWNRGDKSGARPTKQKVALNALMENIERRVIEDILDVIAGDDEDTNDLARVRYEWDGFALPIDVYEKHKTTFESVGDSDNPQHYGMTLKVKTFDTSLRQVVTIPDAKEDGTEEVEPIEFDQTTYDECDAHALCTYDQRKTHFEYFHCHIKNQGVIRKVYTSCGVDGDYVRTVEDYKLQELAAQIPGVLEDANMQDASKQFFKKWMRDPARAWYDKVAWIPFDGVYSPEQHKRLPGRTFNEFPGYSPHIAPPARGTDDGAPDDLDRENFALWKDVATEAAGGPDAFRVLCQLLAHKIKDPMGNLEYTIVWRSRQGEGKDTTISAVENLLSGDMVLRLQQMDGFKSLGGTGRLKNKLIIQVNECEASQMKGLQGWLKSAATDPYIEVRELYKNPEKAKSFGLWVICSNKLYAVSVDTDSGERRYFVFEGSGKYAAVSPQNLPNRVWRQLHNGLKRPGFIRLLYEFFTSKYDPDFDFRAAKQANAQTPAYQRMMGAQRRDELFFLQDWLESQGHVKLAGDLNRTLKGADAQFANNTDLCKFETDGPQFHEHPSWDQKVRVSCKAMYQQFKLWGTVNGQKGAEQRTLKDFSNNLMHVLTLGLAEQALSAGSDFLIEFEPIRLYYTMYTGYMLFPKAEVLPLMEQWREAERVKQEANQPVLTSADSESDSDDEVIYSDDEEE